MKSLLFAFAQSSLPRQPPPSHEPDPTTHRLPPEPTLPTPSHTRTTRNSNVHISPDISVSLQKEGDSSIRQGGNSTARKYTVKPFQSQIQVKVLESSMLRREVTGNRPFENPAQNLNKRSILSSFAKKLTYETEQPSINIPQRQMRDSSPLSSSIKKDRPEQASFTEQRQAGELRSKLAESQILNASLRMQYQIGREKLAAREAELQTLREEHQKLQSQFDQQEKAFRRYQQREEEFAQNKAMVDMFCQEIEQQQSLIATLQTQLQEAQPKQAAYDGMEQKWQYRLQQQISQINQKWQQQAAQINGRCQQGTAQINRKWELRLKQETDAYQLLFETQQRDSACLKEQVSTLRTQKEQYSKDISQAARQRQQLQKALVQSERLLADSEGERKQLQENLMAADGKISILQLQQEEAKRNHIQLQTEQQSAHQANTLKQQTIATITHQLEEERKQLYIERGKVAVAASEKQAAVRHLQVSNRALLESFEKTNREKDASLAQTAQLKQINAALGGEVDALRRQASSLANTLSLHQKTIISKDQEISSLDRKIVQMTKMIQHFQGEISEWKRKLADSVAQLTAKEQQIRRMSMVLSQLQAKVQERNKRISELQLRMVNYQKVIGSYRESLEQLKTTHQTRWQQLKTFYQAQFADLQTQLKEFSDAENSKRNFRAFKKQQLAKQTTITTTTTTTNNNLTMQQSIVDHAHAPATPS